MGFSNARKKKTGRGKKKTCDGCRQHDVTRMQKCGAANPSICLENKLGRGGDGNEEAREGRGRRLGRATRYTPGQAAKDQKKKTEERGGRAGLSVLDAHVVLSGRVDVASTRRDSGPFNSTGRTRGRSYREVLTQRTERVKKELMRADSEKQSLSFTDPANLWFQNLPGRLKCLPLTFHELRGKSRNTFTAARLKRSQIM